MQISLFIPTLVTGIGFLSRYFWERYITNIEFKHKENQDDIDYKLKQFYYPLYFNLNKLSTIFEMICKKKNDNQFYNNLEDECFKIHVINKGIIESNIVKAKPIPVLLKEIFKYNKHITILESLRHCKTEGSNCDCDKPSTFDAKYPDQFMKIIKNRIDVLENV